jgi:fermentation-respiration switch protein FrsA (DUF1100 family)
LYKYRYRGNLRPFAVPLSSNNSPQSRICQRVSSIPSFLRFSGDGSNLKTNFDRIMFKMACLGGFFPAPLVSRLSPGVANHGVKGNDFNCMLRWFERNRVYHPDKKLTATGAELNRSFENARFLASDGVSLHGWFYPALPGSPRLRQVILLCHGNAGNIGHRLDMAEAMLATGVNVFLFDYRGFGLSEGHPGEEGTYLDAEAAWGWLQAKGFAGESIVAFGESLGGGIAAELALRKPLGGLILEGTFASIADLGAELYPWLPVKRLARIKYDTCSKLPAIRIPVMIMHSREDGLIAFHHAERNFKAAAGPKLFWELRGTHNEPVKDRKYFVAGLEKFLGMMEETSRRASGLNPPSAPESLPTGSKA